MKKLAIIILMAYSSLTIADGQLKNEAAKTHTVSLGYKTVELSTSNDYEVDLNIWSVGYQYWFNNIVGAEFSYGQSTGYSEPDSLIDGNKPTNDGNDVKVDSLWSANVLVGNQFSWGSVYGKLGMSAVSVEERNSGSGDENYFIYGVGVQSKPLNNHHVIGATFEMSESKDLENLKDAELQQFGLFYGYRF